MRGVRDGTKGGHAGKPWRQKLSVPMTKTMAQEPLQDRATWHHKADKGEGLGRRIWAESRGQRAGKVTDKNQAEKQETQGM